MTSRFQGGALIEKVVNTGDATYDITSDNEVVICNSSSNDINVNLITAADYTIGRALKIKRIGDYDVTITPQVGELIDGKDGVYPLSDYQCVYLVSNGVDWVTVSESKFNSQLLATIENIDLTSVAQTSIYEVPTDRNLYVTQVFLEITAIDTLTVDPIVRMGLTPNFNQVIDNQTITGLTLVGNYKDLMDFGDVRLVIPGGYTIELDVTTGATAVTYTGKILFFGYLV